MSRKSRIAIAEKARFTQEYPAGNISSEKAAGQAGVADDVILIPNKLKTRICVKIVNHRF
jgi:hypothetical protein